MCMNGLNKLHSHKAAIDYAKNEAWRTPLNNTVELGVYSKPVWLLLVKFSFTEIEKISQLLLASTSSNVLHGWGSEKAFNECLRVSNGFLSAALTQMIIWAVDFLPRLRKAFHLMKGD